MSTVTELLFYSVIIAFAIIIFCLYYKQIKKKKKLAIGVFSGIIILLIVGISFFYNLMEFRVVDKYYPSNECGHWGTASEFINKECRCLGVKFDETLSGSDKSICFGKCIDCKCSIWNITSSRTEINLVNC